MKIERMQVDGGFLDGLDIKFSDGLNTIIGGRGTGKTSVIELLRFCLGVKAQTSDASKEALQHALAVLGDGRVSVTLQYFSGDRVIVSRAADDEIPVASESFETPTIFSQKEIESLGLSAPARLALIDSFRRKRQEPIERLSSLSTQIGSLTSELASCRAEIESFDGVLMELPKIEAELKSHAIVEGEIGKQSQQQKTLRKELEAISAKSVMGIAQINLAQRTIRNVAEWIVRIERAAEGIPEVEEWPNDANSADVVEPIRSALSRATVDLSEVLRNIKDASAKSEVELRALQAKKGELDEKAREIRKQIEAIEAGSGELLRRGAALRERLAALQTTKGLRKKIVDKVKAISEKRALLLDEFEGLHRERYAERKGIADRLTRALGPRIGVGVSQAAEYSSYVNAVVTALRGSGVRYNELAPQIAQRVSPRELVEAIERADAAFLRKTIDIPDDRVQRLVAALRSARLESILTVSVEDDANLSLLDGKDYKSVQQLSVGQRCTVVLPIVLEHRERTLIIDQPEDHLDNAFVVDTLVRGIRNGPSSFQMIFSTHNANIPVLGLASRVFVMQSNGRRAHIAIEGPVDADNVVEAITSIMEGGREAFELRAKFYAEHGEK